YYKILHKKHRGFLRGSGMTQVQILPVTVLLVTVLSVTRRAIRNRMNKLRGLWRRCEKTSYRALGGILLMSILASSAQANYLEHPEAKSLINELVAEEGFQQKELEQWLSKAEKKQNILDAIARPAEK